MKDSPAHIAADVAEQPYAWPGGYPKFAITDDGGCLCPKCCGTEADAIAESNSRDGWHVIAADINWEDTELHCAHCGDLIPAAYADDGEESE